MIPVLLAQMSLADAWSMHGDEIGTGWWIVMVIGMVLFWGLVILGVVWLVREISTPHRRAAGGHDDPLAILDRRLAEGDITVKEYEQRRKTLSG